MSIATENHSALLKPSEQLSAQNLGEEFESWPAMEWPDKPVRIQPPSSRELLKLRVLIVAATVSLIALLVWLLQPAC